MIKFNYHMRMNKEKATQKMRIEKSNTFYYEQVRSVQDEEHEKEDMRRFN